MDQNSLEIPELTSKIDQICKISTSPHVEQGTGASMAIVDGKRCMDRSFVHTIPARFWSKPKCAGLLIAHINHSFVDERVLCRCAF